ncbi:hypothetical protein RJ639_043972 [Escallonia herrerae]|uniref:Uncharacterized protein n=1 Tax=Escallonia herrerae TaxID=1293975 RepID=A0AA88WAV8_9ASTE|nr:hypothetical protein RJ639_043972 [Escallonia herrerae]
MVQSTAALSLAPGRKGLWRRPVAGYGPKVRIWTETRSRRSRWNGFELDCEEAPSLSECADDGSAGAATARSLVMPNASSRSRISKTAKELWDTLKSVYQAEEASTKKFLVSNYMDFKMIDDRPVSVQVRDLQLIAKDMCCRMKDLGEADVILGIKIIRSQHEIGRSRSNSGKVMSLLAIYGVDLFAAGGDDAALWQFDSEGRPIGTGGGGTIDGYDDVAIDRCGDQVMLHRGEASPLPR